MADTDSLLELRAGFGVGILTALARIEGRPVGLMASNPAHLGGAIDADAADKAARFMQLCNAHGLPIVSLVDTPGFMVGPEVETQAQVRHVSRMFVVGAHLRVPFLARRAAQGLRAGRDGDGRRRLPRAARDRGLAERRVRRDGAGGRGAAGLSQGTGGRCPRAPERERCSSAWSSAQYANGKAHQHGGDAGDRRRDRPGADARLAGSQGWPRRAVGPAARGYVDPW